MLYVVAVTRGMQGTPNENEIMKYNLYDTITESVNYVGRHLMQNILEKNTFEVKNAELIITKHKLDGRTRRDREVVLNNWPHEVAMTSGSEIMYGASNIIINKDGDDYNLVTCFGQLMTLNETETKKLVKSGTVANCRFTTDNKLLIYDEHTELDRNTELEAEVALQYNKFITKTRAMGLDMSFEYKVMGDRVKIINYTGTCKKVVVPNFITDITGFAFDHCDIERVSLNAGLRSIGCCAFESCDIQELDIPETVEFIGTAAFARNKQLLTIGSTGRAIFNKETVRVNHDSAVVLGQVRSHAIFSQPKIHRQSYSQGV